ncbi:DUF7685 domain-containing protein [Planococcus sp. X10-3]|uniref:DUF7685 domain-containing protein n=1 Tax=Planococcus sp. X10-3 TaxID=3061240 RepID=UPI003BB1FFE1
MNLKEMTAMALCQRCGSKNTSIHLTSGSKRETLCLKCYNLRMTAELGVETESYPEGMTIRDGEGQFTIFRFKSDWIHLTSSWKR